MTQKSKHTWKITRQKSTGKLIFSYFEGKNINANDLEEIEPFSFSGELVYHSYSWARSGISIGWKSKLFPETTLWSSYEILHNLFSVLKDSSVTVTNVTPLTIDGTFRFVKRGTEIRIIEEK